ncbi:TPA: tetratricopeptide repeat protein [Salmonella enterica]
MKKVKYRLLSVGGILFAIIYGSMSERDSTLYKLKSAGENGDVEAQYALGLMYYYGEHVDVDYTQAKIWYEKAAAQNDSRAQVNRGEIYAHSMGVNQDYQQSK